MALRFVLDENLRGPLWDIILRHNIAGSDPIDVVRVGDMPDLPLGTIDPMLLRWAEKESRIIISEDKRTMATHLAAHIAAGHHSPGVITPRVGIAPREILEFLVLAAYATEPQEWENRVTFIP